ncbi:MAG: GspH/FimT family pseudopilin [Thiolinea sp.]
MNTTRQSGISLVEILVTLAIIAVLASVAAPNLQSLIEKNKVHSTMDEFANSLYRVRSEAAKRGFHVSMCASNAAKTDCDNSVATDFSDGFTNGWIIFTDYDANGELGAYNLFFDTTGDGAANATEEILFVSDTDPNSKYVVKSTSADADTGRMIRYRSDGLLDGTLNRGYVVTEKGSDVQLAKISIARTGRIRSCAGDTVSCSCVAIGAACD